MLKIEGSYVKNPSKSIGNRKLDSLAGHHGIFSNQKQPPEVFYKKGVLRNFAKFTGKHCFPGNFAKVVRTPFLQNTSGRLLLSNVFVTCAVW